MSDYTPTTQHVRAVWLDAYPDEFRGQGGAAFDRFIAALHAEWEAEQGEVEWEYGWKSHFPNGEEYEWKALPTREDAEEEIRFNQDFEDSTEQIGGRLTFTLWKRTKAKAGPWVPVNENGER